MQTTIQKRNWAENWTCTLWFVLWTLVSCIQSILHTSFFPFLSFTLPFKSLGWVRFVVFVERLLCSPRLQLFDQKF